ncbi:hypothetical protein V2J09_012123 [Rumex salicifolius]
MGETSIYFRFRHLSNFSGPNLHQFLPNSSLFPWRKGFQLKFVEGNDNWEPKKRLQKLRISPIVEASSSSSPALGGSSSPEYSEQLLGERPKKKKQSIAGIDQDVLLDPAHLADPDSSFREFMGVHIHYKVSEVEPGAPSSSLDRANKIGVPMILLHGFGASVFSWHRVIKPLSQCIGSKALAFDRPAFGLTSRVGFLEDSPARVEENSLNPYSTKFSVLTTLHFMDFIASDKAILVGHSAGSLTAVSAYFEAPERVAALILVAPAIVAPLSGKKVDKSQAEKEMQTNEQDPDSGSKGNFFMKLGQILSRAYQFIALTIMRFVTGMMGMVNSVYKKALSAILRSAVAVTLVRMIIDKFGIAAIKNSWYDASLITDHILQGYTKPLRTKGWDKALVEYTVAMLTDSAAESKPSPTGRLHEISCPVLIVTGDSDRLVPPWNSKRLASVIPGSQLEIIKNCGHLPHEERPEEFLSIVEKFLQRVFSGSEDWCLQA